MHRGPTVRSGRLVRLVAVALLASTVMVVGGAGPVAAVEHPPSFITTWGTYGSGNGRFDGPNAVGVDPTTGDVYVTDFENSRVQKFDADGNFLTKWGTRGGGNGQFRGPYGVAVDPTTGNVYVADTLNDRVQKFDSDGTFLTAWGSTGTGDGQFFSPEGVVVDPATGDVYVTDTLNNRVQKFDSDGTFLTKWGTFGTGNGQFDLPEGVAVDPTGDVYVTDFGNDRVQEFDADGTFLTKWGTSGSGNGQFNVPHGVAVDPATGDVYVTDAGNDRVQKFDTDGTFLTKWGTFGYGNGQFILPQGVAVDPSTGDVYVTDVLNDRVQKFGYRGRPDGRLRRGTGVLVGNDIYNTTGTHQTSNGAAARGHSVTYYASIQNDARFAERIRVRGQASTPNFTVRYYNPAGANITPQVIAGTFRTPILTPEATYRVEVVVTVLRTAHPGASVARTLTATSTTYPTLKDTVRFITSRDLMVIEDRPARMEAHEPGRLQDALAAEARWLERWRSASRRLHFDRQSG